MSRGMPRSQKAQNFALQRVIVDAPYGRGGTRVSHTLLTVSFGDIVGQTRVDWKTFRCNGPQEMLLIFLHNEA